MTTEHPDPSEDAVRRLLAAAADPDPPVPDQVARRLDDVLAGLVAEREAADRPAEVVALASRRPRRWPKYLVAAAAVSVVGFGVGNVMTQSGSDTDMSTAGQADSESAPERVAPSGDGGGSAADSPPETGADTDGRTSLLHSVALRSRSLAADVQRAADQAVAGPVELAATCVEPPLGDRDEWLRVRLDGAPAVLVLRPAEGGRRVADVFACDDAEAPVATTTIPAQ